MEFLATLSRLFFGPPAEQSAPKIEITAEFFFAEKTEEDIEISRLGREATVHKAAKDWEPCIECLYRARELMTVSGIGFGFNAWLRLPLVLQQAGKMDEAEDAFRWLVSDIDRQVARMPDYHPQSAHVLSKHRLMTSLYKSWSLASKRQKLLEQANLYLRLSEEQHALAEKQQVIVDRVREQERAKRERERVKRR